MRYINEVCLNIATFADLFIKCACLILTHISFEEIYMYYGISTYLLEILIVDARSCFCMFTLCQFLKCENYIYGVKTRCKIVLFIKNTNQNIINIITQIDVKKAQINCCKFSNTVDGI